MNKYNIRRVLAIFPKIDLSKMDENQIEIYYAMIESIGSFKNGMDALSQTEASDWMLRELTNKYTVLEEIIYNAIPGEGGTPKSNILTAIEPVENYIFEISSSLSTLDFYSLTNVQNALDTMYLALGSLKDMTETYFPATSQQVAPETTTPETPEAETVEPEITEDEQILEQKEDEAKDIIDTTINSNLPSDEKKREINDTLNEIGYLAVKNVLKRLNKYNQTNIDAKELCFKEVLDSFLEIVNESVLSKYLNIETLEADARYVADYFYNMLSTTMIEME